MISLGHTLLRLYIARHGQNEDNAHGILNGHRDLPLTDIGKSQAREVAQKIKAANLSFDAVLSSPLIRAHETATIIAAINQLPTPQVMPELIERDFGIMTGKAQSAIEEMCAPDIIKTETITYFLSPPGAETFPDLLLRAGKLLDTLHETYTSGNILLVTHGDLGKMIYAKYYGLDWKDVLTLFHFGNSELLILSPDTAAGEAHLFQIAQHNI
jgi:broad specificity phosphatase PhoE